MNTATAQLYAIATGPTDINWRDAFARRHEQAEARERDLLEQLATLTARIAELEADDASPMDIVCAAATELAELTGESCHVEASAWYHPTAARPISAEWHAYRAGQIPARYTGKTCEEATAKVRADWENAIRDDTAPIDMANLANTILAGPTQTKTDDYPF